MVIYRGNHQLQSQRHRSPDNFVRHLQSGGVQSVGFFRKARQVNHRKEQVNFHKERNFRKVDKNKQLHTHQTLPETLLHHIEPFEFVQLGNQTVLLHEQTDLSVLVGG